MHFIPVFLNDMGQIMEAQTARGDVCTIRFRTRGGRATDPTDVPRTTFERDVSYNGTLTHLSRPGTLYFTDNRFLLSSAAYRAAGWPFSGVWMSGAALPDAVVVDGDLTMDRTWLIFPKSGLSLSVSGDLTMTGTGWYAGLENGLELTNGTVTVGGNLTLNGSRLGLYAGGAVSVGGNLVMAAPVDKEHAGGQIEIVAAVTNGTEECGASVSVGKTWTIAKNCRVYPVASTNGAIVKLTAQKMTVAEGGMINASLRGYPEGKGPGAPLHSYAGASYGGLGGAYPGYENKLAATYGDEKRPLAPGSAGLRQNNSYPCYAGGGAVWLEVAKALTLDGLVQADGNWKFCTYASGCSGGAVYIRALHLYGSGSVVARGGDCRDALVTPGGGGRVAIWCCENQSSIYDNVSVDAGCFDGKRYTEPTTSAEDGSVFWGDLPLPGTLLLVR